MKKLLSVVLGIFVAGAFPAAALAAGESYSLAPWVEDSSRSYLLSRNAGPTTHTFDGVAESIGESRYGPVGGTLYVEEDSFSVVPGIDRYVVEVTALDVAGYPTHWVNYQWAGIGLIRWRLDVGSTYGGADPINFDSPVEVVDSGYSVFDRMGNWLGDYELYADTSTATSLSGVAIHSNGGQDIAGVDVSTIQMWWDVLQPDAASPPTVVTSPASSIGETAALLSGTANPNGAATSAWFEWGNSSSYGNVTSPQTNVGLGTSAISYGFNLGALTCGTTYHFRAVAQNSGGTAYGSDRSFTTSACPTPVPTVVTSPAGSIGETAALLSGTANPNGANTSAWFQWGTSTAYGNATAGTNVGSGTSPASYSSNLSALQCGTTYHFRAVAQNSGGTAYGSDRSFTTSACPTPVPTVVTSPAGSIGETAALLSGTANPNGASTSAWFQWGTSTAYGNATAGTNVGSGTSPASYSSNLSALQCGTTYHFRAVAQNSGGAAYGSDRSFTTSACPTPVPTVVTSPASSIGETAALLSGTADPNGASTSAWFQWGTTSGYGNTTAGTNVGSGTSPASYSSNLSALQCGTTYHFRAVAQNSGGTAYGSDRSFTTSACPTPVPTVVTSPASSIGETAALLSGTANPNGASTSAWFEWGNSSSYGNVTSPQTNVGLGTSAISYGFNLGALTCGTTYHFRAVAQNSGGTAYGSDRSFTTSACPTPVPTVVTSPASSIGETAALLSGTANPNGASTSAWFQWGTSTAYGNATAGTNVGSGTSPASYSSNLSALQCGTTYHFRAVAQNSGGAAYGSDRSFTTSACPTPVPTVVTSPASSIGETAALLSGTADPNGASTSAWFQWGTTSGYGNTTAGTNVGSGTSPASYSSNLSALQCGTTYHFRAVAQNSGGTAYGSDRSFTTSACSTPLHFTVGGTVSGLSGNGLVLRNNGGDQLTINDNGSFTFATPLNDGSAYSVTISTQPKGRTKYCAVANGSGVVNGADVNNVVVTCGTEPATEYFTVGGNVSGLSGTGLVLRNNGGDSLTVNTNGSFTFSTSLADGSAYSVTVATQPGSQNETCSVSNGSGALAGSDITNVSVTCETDPGPGQDDVIMGDGFETGNNDGWSSKGKVSIDGVLAIDQYSLRHTNGAESAYSVSTVGYQDVSVTMHLAATSLRSGDTCVAEVSTDGGDSWMPLVTLQNAKSSGAFFSGTVFPPGADDNLDVKLRFRASGRGNKGYCYGDEVYVMGTPIGG